MTEFKWVGKVVPRIDGVEKATGRLKYLTDIGLPGLLHGRILRSKYPHALIKRIDTSRAEALPGVVKVLTYKDVPGVNGFGIIIPDQPVFCREKVRYVGDAVAGVVAENPVVAEEALELIAVEYEPLPVVDDPEAAMAEDAPRVHEKGNIHQEVHVRHGDVAAGFAEADLIVENVYHTSRQMHTFLETEGGLAFFDEEGMLNVWVGSQYPQRDQLQLARILGLNPRKIRVVSSPTGGGFGGKDELTIQPQLAVMAYVTKRPVKLWLSREESVVSGWKRHPMKLYYKTGFKKDGTLVANEIKIVADTGAYASLGGPVVSLAVESSCGPYRIPNTKIDGYCVYTNNGVAGAFRGFGVPQVTFAMESQMEIAREKLGLDPVTIRKKNLLERGDVAPLGHTMTASVGILNTLERAEASDLWQNREQLKAAVDKPWKKRGVGLAVALQGTGLGVGIPDYGAAIVELTEDGHFIVRVGSPEIGQGNMTAYAITAAEALGCDLGLVRVVSGDTKNSPDSGTSTASRSAYTGGNAILDAVAKLKPKLLAVAGQLLGRPPAELKLEGNHILAPATGRRLTLAELGRYLREKGLEYSARGNFVWPTADISIEGAEGLPHLIYTFVTQVALVEVDTLTGKTQVLQTVTALDAGRVLNRQGLEGQAEGGAVMGAGYVLMEDTIIEKGYFKTMNLSTYIIPTSLDIPQAHEVELVEVLEETGPYGAKGAGEAVMVPIGPAIISAIHDAVGVRLFEIPATAERVYHGLRGEKRD